jgi:hypothetical protein
MNFYHFFLLLWVIFARLDPDPDSEYGSGSTDPIEYGSNTDPDPQPCLQLKSYQSLTKIVRCRDEIMRRDEIR